MKYSALLILILSNLLFAQVVDTLNLTVQNQYVVVDSILITGNDITEEFIILREMTIEEGDTVNKKLLDFNRERVYSLSLFNYVNFHLLQEDEQVILNIDVLEKWYFYPLPFVYFNEGNFKNPTYGINFSLQNFRGRDETINVFLALGYDPAVSVSYSNPAFIFGNDIGFGFQVGYQDFANKSYNAEVLAGGEYEYTIYSTSLSFRKRIDQFHSFSLSPGYFYVEPGVPSVGNITASGKQFDNILSLTAEYLFDSRDLKQFPKTGIFSLTKFTHKGFGIDGISYNILQIDFRQYNELLKDVTARWRAAYRNSFGDTVPFYDYSFFGYDEYVRGHRDDDSEGLQYLLGSLEMSYAIVKEWNFSLDLPLLPRSLTSTRIGVNFNIFADAGTTFNNFEELKFNSFVSGYGFGLNILFLPFNSVRLEYAFDEYMNAEFLVGIGFSF